MKKEGKANGHAGRVDLPEGWVWTTLDDIGDWHGGGTPTTTNAAYWEVGSIMWVSPKDMKSEVVRSTEDRITQAAIENSAAKLIPENSVLIVTRSGILKHSLPVATLEERVALNQDLKALTPRGGIVPRYIAFSLRWLEKRILRECTKDGTTVQSVETSRLKRVCIALAPLREQARIVAKLDELFSDIEVGEKAVQRAALLVKLYRQAVLKAAVTGELTKNWREKNLAHLKREKKTGADLLAEILVKRRASWEAAELAKMTARGKPPKDDKWKRKYVDPVGPNFDGFGDLPELPDGWAWGSVGQVGQVTGGLTKNAARNSKPLKRPYLRVANVYANLLNLDEVHEIGVAPSELDRVTLKQGDLLVVEGNGSPDQIGRVALWDGSIEGCVHQNHLIKVRFAERSYARLVLQWLLSGDGRACIGKVASSTSGLHTLSISKIERLPVPIPPQDELKPISSACDEADTLVSHSVEELDRVRQLSRSLRHAVLKAAFLGQLVSQNPNDEPASALIERIRAERNAQKPSTPKAQAKANKPGTRRGRSKKATESRNAQGKVL